jgi:hypothetical protein
MMGWVEVVVRADGVVTVTVAYGQCRDGVFNLFGALLRCVAVGIDPVGVGGVKEITSLEHEECEQRMRTEMKVTEVVEFHSMCSSATTRQWMYGCSTHRVGKSEVAIHRIYL